MFLNLSAKIQIILVTGSGEDFFLLKQRYLPFHVGLQNTHSFISKLSSPLHLETKYEI